MGVSVAVLLGVSVASGVAVSATAALLLAVLDVAVGCGVAVGSGVAVKVKVGMLVAVSLGGGVAVFVAVAVSVAVEVGSARKKRLSKIELKIGSSVVAVSGTALAPKRYERSSFLTSERRTIAGAPPINTASKFCCQTVGSLAAF